MRILLLLFVSSLLNVANVQNSIAQSQVRIERGVKKSYNGSDISCANETDGQNTVTASGGSGTYEYSKNVGISFQKDNILKGLKVEAKTVVKVRDANNHNNVSEALYVWIANVKPVFTNTFQRETYYNNRQDGVSCADKSDGRIFIQAHGGTTPYTFSMDGGVTFKSENSFRSLSAGTYSGIAKDQKNKPRRLQS